ncbi:MAG: CARDB domain-containing protein [Thermoplasmatota archaeon]
MKAEDVAIAVVIVLLISMALVSNFENVDGQSSQDGLDGPSAVIDPFPDVKMGDTVIFNGSGSYDPNIDDEAGKGIIEWSWYIRDEGDNWTQQSMMSEKEVFSKVLNIPGTFVINLTVMNRSGIEGWTEKILFVSGPDLQVVSITFPEPDDLKEGDKPKISVRFMNAGTVEITDPWNLQIIDNGMVVKQERFMTLIAPGQTRYYNFSSVVLKAGERGIMVVLDSDDDILEMNEENNYLKIWVDVKEPDLTIGGLPVILILIFIILTIIIGLGVAAAIVIPIKMNARGSK